MKNISKNKLLLFVVFLATIAVVFNLVDYWQSASDSLNQSQIKEKESAIILNQSSFAKSQTKPLFTKSEQSTTYNPTGVVTSSVEQTNISQNQNKLVSVLRVIDGDTIVVNIDGLPVHVRLIGINSPELNDKRKQVACFGEKAKEEAEKLLDGQNIYLEKDSTQGDYDKYNRLLAYVFIGGSTPLVIGGTNFNELMIEEGYAYEYTYNLPYKYQKEFKDAQIDAKTAGKGLWDTNFCAN